MDSPWVGSIWQRVAKLRLGPPRAAPRSRRHRERAVGRICAPHRRAGVAYSRRVLRIRLRRIREWRARAADMPRRFLFVGRYVEAKDLRTLVRGYQAYRERVSDPWPLTCRGTDRMRHCYAISRASPTPDSCSPRSCRRRFASTACSSCPAATNRGASSSPKRPRRDLPVICSDACGAADDLVRPASERHRDSGRRCRGAGRRDAVDARPRGAAAVARQARA